MRAGTPFHPEPEQIAALSRWLSHPEVARTLAALMPLVGGPREACERRVLDVARALAIAACAPQGSPTQSPPMHETSISRDEEIWRMRKAGMSYAEIARQIRTIGAARIRHICNRRTNQSVTQWPTPDEFWP